MPQATSITPASKIALYNNLDSQGINPMVNPFPQTPPDSTGAIGPSNYVEVVNSTIEAWDRTNLNGVAEVSLQTFTAQSSNVPFCDPQIQWDPSTGHWLYSFLYCNINDPNQGFFFGWSKTSDPTNLLANNTTGAAGTGGWCAFFFPTASNLFDFVKLGHNTNYMIFGGNYYSENPAGNPNPPFVTAQILWITKPSTPTDYANCNIPGTFDYTRQNPLKNGDGVSNTFTPVPVNTQPLANDGYVLSAYDPSGSNGQTPSAQNRLALWHLDSSGVIHRDPDIAVNTYNVPASAPQLGSTNNLDTLDARLTQAVGEPVPGIGIWTQHTVDGPGGRSAVDWYEITVFGGVASLAQQGQISNPTDFVFNAAISPNSAGSGAAIFYNRSSPSIDPVIASRIRHSTTAPGTFEPPELVLATSTTADSDFSCNSPRGAPCRWGDYSGASPDPSQLNVVWGTNERSAPCACSVTWADQNFAVSMAASAPLAPTGVSAVPDAESAYVTWTASAVDSQAPVTGYTVKAYIGVTFIGSMPVAANATIAHFTGLIDGTSYTFTVIAQSSAGPSTESAHSNAVTPTRAIVQISPSPPPSRLPNDQLTPPPSPQPR